MPNQRKKNKKLVGFFADPLEYEAIQKLAKTHAVSVAELLRRIANGTIKLGLWVLGGLVGFAALALPLSTASPRQAGTPPGAPATAAAPALRVPGGSLDQGVFASAGIERIGS